MDQICTKSPIVNFGPWSLISGKKYYVDTQFGNWKGTIHGTFDRYEQNKIMCKDECIWSIVLTNWWGDGLGYTHDTQCRSEIYLDPIDNLVLCEE